MSLIQLAMRIVEIAAVSHQWHWSVCVEVSAAIRICRSDVYSSHLDQKSAVDVQSTLYADTIRHILRVPFPERLMHRLNETNGADVAFYQTYQTEKVGHLIWLV